MNIVKLFYHLKLDPKKILELNDNEIIRIEKQINLETKLNPENFDVTSTINFINVLKKYRESFYTICNTRIIFNTFTDEYHLQSIFGPKLESINMSEVHLVLDNYLLDELKSFISKKLSENNFEDIEYFLNINNYLSPSTNDFIKNRLITKCNSINLILSSKNIASNELKPLSDPFFYKTLNHYASPEMDEVVSNLVDIASDGYNTDKRSYIYVSILMKMIDYHAFSSDLNDVIFSNKKVVTENMNASNQKTSNEKSSFSPWTIVWLVILVLRLLYYCSR